MSGAALYQRRRRRAAGGAAAPAGVTITDSFNRADSTLTLGNADTGQAWVAVDGTWGIDANQAYLVADGPGTRNVAVIDCGAADGSVQVKGSVLTVAGLNVDVRVTDAANYVFLTYTGGTTVTLNKFVAGATTAIASNSAVTVATGDVFRVEMSGANYTVKQNGVTIITGTDATFQTVTKHGIGQGVAPTANIRFDDFSFVNP